MRSAFTLACALATVLGACGDGGAGGSSISMHPLEGKINGKPWMFVDGQTDFFLSQSGDRFFASLYDRPATMCSPATPPGATSFLILNIPKAVGTYGLSLDLNQTFTFTDANGQDHNDVATSGQIAVTELTATTLKGGVNMTFDANNTVDGTFEIGVCAQ